MYNRITENVKEITQVLVIGALCFFLIKGCTSVMNTLDNNTVEKERIRVLGDAKRDSLLINATP